MFKFNNLENNEKITKSELKDIHQIIKELNLLKKTYASNDAEGIWSNNLLDETLREIIKKKKF